MMARWLLGLVVMMVAGCELEEGAWPARNGPPADELAAAGENLPVHTPAAFAAGEEAASPKADPKAPGELPGKHPDSLPITPPATWIGSGKAPDTQPVPTGPGALVSGLGCDQVQDKIRERLIAAADAAVDSTMENFYWEYCSWDYFCDDDDDDGVSYGDPGPPEPQGESAKEYSETNTQVQGVDEADFVKNDGSYIYLAANGRLQILDAWPPEQMHKVADVAVEGTVKKLYVKDDVAVVYSSGNVLPDPFAKPWSYYYYGNGTEECTYGYDCEFTGDGKEALVLVYDLADKAAPVLTRRLAFNGSYVNSRRIGDAVYTALTFPAGSVAGLQFLPGGLWPGSGLIGWDVCNGGDLPQEVVDAFEELKIENHEKIMSMPLDQLLPTATDTVYSGGVAVANPISLTDCGALMVSAVESNPGFIGMIGIDMAESSPIALSLIVGKPGAVYASADSLYLAVRQYQGTCETWPFGNTTGAEVTVLHKFALHPDTHSGAYAASGVVKGRVLNQFSMDEFEGAFRIATTTGHLPSPDVHSTVSVLVQNGTSLVPSGVIDNIAPTEDIRSARFNGPVGYIVTFKKTDPLFVLDLADPVNPHIDGELKIPGFSTYMHMLDDTHILSIGYDADDMGSFAWFDGIMLQIFDVSDLANPTLLHKEVIGTRGTTSDAATNHLAFNYFKPKQWLALPMVVCEEGGNGSYGDVMTFNGLMVYKAAVESGFQYLGGIPHAALAGQTYGCYNWWTESNSKVKRSIFMDDFAFSVAMDEVKVAHIDTLALPLAAVSIK